MPFSPFFSPEPVDFAPKTLRGEPNTTNKRKREGHTTNHTVGVVDTNIPDGLDGFLAMCTAYQRILNGRDLLAMSLDFSHAYKHVPLLKSQEEFASIIFAQPEGEPLVATLRTQPFGPSRAPANWARVTEYVKFVIGRLFDIHLKIFGEGIKPNGC